MPDRQVTPDDLEYPDYCRDEHEDMRSLIGKTVTHTGWIDGWPTIFFSDGSSFQSGGYDTAWVIVNAVTWVKS